MGRVACVRVRRPSSNTLALVPAELGTIASGVGGVPSEHAVVGAVGLAAKEERAVTPSEEVRAFVFEHYVRTARLQGEKVLIVRAGDVHRDMGFSNRLPLVCSAISALQFQERYRVRLLKRGVPGTGANTRFTFEV